MTAHILKAAQGADAAILRSARGYDGATWDAARDAAHRRGVRSPDGGLSPAGVELVARIEGLTDGLAGTALTGVSAAAAARLKQDLRTVVDPVLAADLVPFPNPIGLPQPT